MEDVEVLPWFVVFTNSENGVLLRNIVDIEATFSLILSDPDALKPIDYSLTSRSWPFRAAFLIIVSTSLSTRI